MLYTFSRATSFARTFSPSADSMLPAHSSAFGEPTSSATLDASRPFVDWLWKTNVPKTLGWHPHPTLGIKKKGKEVLQTAFESSNYSLPKTVVLRCAGRCSVLCQMGIKGNLRPRRENACVGGRLSPMRRFCDECIAPCSTCGSIRGARRG